MLLFCCPEPPASWRGRRWGAWQPHHRQQGRHRCVIQHLIWKRTRTFWIPLPLKWFQPPKYNLAVVTHFGKLSHCEFPHFPRTENDIFISERFKRFGSNKMTPFYRWGTLSKVIYPRSEQKQAGITPVPPLLIKLYHLCNSKQSLLVRLLNSLPIFITWKFHVSVSLLMGLPLMTNPSSK